MNGTIYMPVGEVCSSISDTYREKKNMVTLINTSDVLEGRVLNHERVPNSNLKGQFKKTFQRDDILYSEIRPQNRRFAYVDFSPIDYIASTKLMVIRAKKDVVSPKYLYYFLKNSSTVAELQLLAETRSGTFPQITFSEVANLTIPVPSLAVQEVIVQTMQCLEDKITCNEQINDNLEQQAQAIFKEWFIENPENNEWSTGTFAELIKTTLNGDWGKEAPTGNSTEKVYCIRGADIPEVKAGNKGKMPTRYILPKNFVKKQLTAGDIVVEISGGSPTQSTGRCTAITQSLLDRYDSGMVCTNFCKAIKPKEGYSLFIYYYWQYLYGKGIFFSYENGTTGIKNLDFSGFIETETILIPPVDKVIAFDDYCKSIFNQIFANGKQNEHLAVLRDTLLPKLMSGELDVSDIDL